MKKAQGLRNEAQHNKPLVSHLTPQASGLFFILSARRIYALVFRYITLLLHSLPRLFESLYWPVINTMLLGFMNYYLLKQRGIAEVNFHSILGATLLLEFFIRSQISFMLVFVEEIYSRNLGQLYTGPMRGWEQLTAYFIIMLIRMLALIPAIFLCALMFDYNILSLGEWLFPLTANMLLARHLRHSAH